jgi:glutathione S-transferase
MKARKQYDVKYPALYADSGHKNPTHAEAFNRVQRGHQNFLENAPGFLLMALTSSLFYPVTSAAAVVIYYAGRLVYATGYAEKNEARNRGAFSYIGLLTLLGGALRGSVGLAMPIIRGALNI